MTRAQTSIPLHSTYDKPSQLQQPPDGRRRALLRLSMSNPLLFQSICIENNSSITPSAKLNPLAGCISKASRWFLQGGVDKVSWNQVLSSVGYKFVAKKSEPCKNRIQWQLERLFDWDLRLQLVCSVVRFSFFIDKIYRYLFCKKGFSDTGGW